MALFDYDPVSMSPNPDAGEEELPFREGQILKVSDSGGLSAQNSRIESLSGLVTVEWLCSLLLLLFLFGWRHHGGAGEHNFLSQMMGLDPVSGSSSCVILHNYLPSLSLSFLIGKWG